MGVTTSKAKIVQCTIILLKSMNYKLNEACLKQGYCKFWDTVYLLHWCSRLLRPNVIRHIQYECGILVVNMLCATKLINARPS